MLIKGLKTSSFMTGEFKDMVYANTGMIVLGCMVFLTILMQVLHWLKVNVFKVVILMGTFALALAFAGNDLVNFIGVPLAGYSSFIDYTANGTAAGPDGFLMSSLLGAAKTPWYFLIGAGAIMVYALCTSKKAHNVIKTSVDLARQDDGEENFGSTPIARTLVRFSMTLANGISKTMPESSKRWMNTRFQKDEAIIADGAAFDLVRASVNLVLAGLLIALGTSLKLPLSTTYVTFMVAMGTSLADRAWSRESAVFRITGVLTVIGGWFITAGVAFTACFFVAMAMNFGGVVAAVIIVSIGIYSIIHSQQRFNKKQKEEAQQGDILFQQMLQTTDRTQIVPMLTRHINMSVAEVTEQYADLLVRTTDGLFGEHLRPMRQSIRTLNKSKRELKNLRRRETLCLRRAEPPVAGIRLSTNFHLIHNSLRQMLYGLIRIAEPAYEHVDNHFSPIDATFAARYTKLRTEFTELIAEIAGNFRNQRSEDNDALMARCSEIRSELHNLGQEIGVAIQTTDVNLTAITLMLHLVQETEQLLVEVKELLKNTKLYREMV